MTPEHKALVDRLRDNPTIPTDSRAAADAIEALAARAEAAEAKLATTERKVSDLLTPTPQVFIDAKKERDEGWPEIDGDTP